MFPATTNPSATILGYHADLPIKAGDTVVIPKGTRITGMGKVKERVAGKDYSVVVNHTLTGRSFCIGYVLKDGTRRPAGLHRHDVQLIVDLYGTTPENLINHPNTVVVESLNSVYLPIENPTVRWPGVGGYWQEVDINDVRKLSPELQPVRSEQTKETP